MINNMKKAYKCRIKSNQDNRLVFALVLIIFGCAILVGNLNLLSTSLQSILFSWENLLIILGVVFIFVKKEFFTGISLIFIGLIFIAPAVLMFVWPDLHINNFNAERLFFPFFTISIGIYVLLKHKKCQISKSDQDDFGSRDYVDELKIFGGGETNVVSDNFRGGRITCIFGGVQIDCTEAKLSEDFNQLDMFLVMGGCSLIIPSSWNVKMQSSVFLAGIADKRKVSVRFITDENKELLIKGVICMGGCEIISEKRM